MDPYAYAIVLDRQVRRFPIGANGPDACGRRAFTGVGIERMKRYLLLIFLIANSAGCAGTTSLLPPIAVPVPGGAQEFRFKSLKWKPDTLLKYDLHEFTEARMGESIIDTYEEQHVFQAKVQEHTDRSGSRVLLSHDEVDLGFVIFDENGRSQDGVPTRLVYWAALQGFVRWSERSAGAHANQRSLRLGETIRTELFTPGWKASVPGFASDVNDPIIGEITFRGYAKLDDVLVAVVNTKSPNLIRKPFVFTSRDRKTTYRIDALSWEGTSYLDPSTGLELVSYEVMMGTGSVDGKPIVFRMIVRSILDRKRSRGF
jgi:hypothetical protein